MVSENNNHNSLERYHRYTAWGASGTPEGVDYLMRALLDEPDFATTRLVDYSLSLVRTRAGSGRIEHYLFNGISIQRNYAALYFKRRGMTSTLDKALSMGLIDDIQAYSE